MLMRKILALSVLFHSAFLLASTPTITKSQSSLLGSYGYSLVSAKDGSGHAYLGNGISSNVYRLKGNFIAKVFNRDAKSEGCFEVESMILKELDHPNIVRLHEVIDKDNIKMLILDYAGPIEFFDFIMEPKYKDVLRKQGKSIIKQLADAMDYLHAQGIVVCDVKPSNIMLQKNSAGMYIVKVIDFGLAQQPPEIVSSKIRGTFSYFPPEVFQRGYSVSSARDMWSIGFIIYAMLTKQFAIDLGSLAIKVKNLGLARCGVDRFDWSFKGKHLGAASEDKELRSVLDGLLTKDPKSRMTAKELLDHPWLDGVSNPAFEDADEDEVGGGGGGGGGGGAAE